MPTENRSSNTEMVSVPRERLHQFIEYSASVCKSPAWVKDKAALLAALEQPAPQPHPDPIAWMVGTAFWWAKEEAERDAAATGLPIVGLGPMTLAAPAQQHQGEPVALTIPDECPHIIVFDDADRANEHFCGAGARPAALRRYEQISQSWNAHLFVRVARNSRDDRYPSAKIADPAEVEQLRAVIDQQKSLIASLRAELVESYSIGASAEPSSTGDGVRDERDYAIEHAGYLADAADQVLADYQAYSLAQMLENKGGDDGDGEHAEAVDSARDELHEGLANLRSMTYEFRKRRPRSNQAPL